MPNNVKSRIAMNIAPRFPEFLCIIYVPDFMLLEDEFDGLIG